MQGLVLRPSQVLIRLEPPFQPVTDMNKLARPSLYIFACTLIAFDPAAHTKLPIFVDRVTCLFRGTL